VALSTPLTSPELAASFRAAGYWRDVTIYERFRSAAEANSTKIAIVDGNRRISYAELLTTVQNVASNLLDLGVPPGGVVAMQSRNAAELAIFHLAAHRIGRLYMPLHDSWRELELLHLLRQSRAGVLVIPGVYRGFDYAAMIWAIREQLPNLHHIFTLDGRHADLPSFASLMMPGRRSVAALNAELPDPDAPATIMLSGGTTSLSKMSRFSSNNLLNMLNCYAESVEYSSSDVSAAIAPAGTGATGYIYPILTPLIYGGTSVILRRWSDPAEAIDLILGERCSHATGIPAQLTMLVPHLETRVPADFDAFRVFTNAGASLPYDTAVKIEKLMGCAVQSIYGSTDGGTPTMTRLDDPQEKRLSSVGRIVRGCDCELWNAAGERTSGGERGEIVWRGPDKSWGYLADEAATHAAFSADGFYRSGDLGEFDADGYLRIVGRIKDMILRGGRNISPRTIEEALIKHPAVLQVAVAAMPDPILGERACAFVCLRNGASLDFNEMNEFLTEAKLAIWQLPERLEILAELPLSTGGKVAKRQLTQFVTDKLEGERTDQLSDR
jgi:non-ribosomal peptide synthetase component E (peptide arylation enzyme)